MGPISLGWTLSPPYEVVMVVTYKFNLHHSFSGTQKDKIFTIISREPLNLAHKRIFFFLFLLFFCPLSTRVLEGKGEALGQAWHCLLFKFIVETRSSRGSRLLQV